MASESNLELANRHVAEGLRRIADQKARVSLLQRGGYQLTEANRLLALLEDTLKVMIEHRNLLLGRSKGKRRR